MRRGKVREERFPWQSIAGEGWRGRYPARARGKRRFGRERFLDETERVAYLTILKASSTPPESAGNLRKLGAARSRVSGARGSGAPSSARFSRVAMPQGLQIGCADRMWTVS